MRVHAGLRDAGIIIIHLFREVAASQRKKSFFVHSQHIRIGQALILRHRLENGDHVFKCKRGILDVRRGNPKLFEELTRARVSADEMPEVFERCLRRISGTAKLGHAVIERHDRGDRGAGALRDVIELVHYLGDFGDCRRRADDGRSRRRAELLDVKRRARHAIGEFFVLRRVDFEAERDEELFKDVCLGHYLPSRAARTLLLFSS